MEVSGKWQAARVEDSLRVKAASDRESASGRRISCGGSVPFSGRFKV
jgi:hypothetical protein